MSLETQIAIIEQEKQQDIVNILDFYKQALKVIPRKGQYEKGSAEQKMCDLYLQRSDNWNTFLHNFCQKVTNIEAAKKGVADTLIILNNKCQGLKDQ